MTTTKITMTVSGETYKAREKMKDEGFSWDANSKSWSREYTQDGDVFRDDMGNDRGTMESIRHMIRCYAKSDRFAIVIN